MKKSNKLLLTIICIFIILLSTTILISFSSNTNTQEVLVKSITPIYDSTSTIVVDSNNVVFNDKNQEVDYKVVIENTQNYDVKITDIQLSTPTEEFLIYEIKNINENDILEANSTKELIISLETTGIKGWGRNFNDELTANISFERVRKNEPVDPPKEEENNEEVETPKEEIKQPEPPAPTIKEVIKQTEKIEPTKVTKDVIEFKEEVKVNVGDKIAVWIYSEPIFLGYFDVVETNGVKQIVGLEEALKKADIEVGEHNIVLETEDKEVLGYVEIYINEDKDLLSEKPQDTTDKEDKPAIENKPATDNKNESEKEDDGKVDNPYTSDKGLLVVLVIATGVTGLGIILVSKNKFTKYTVLVILLSSTLTITNAEEVIELPVKFNVKFESQNVMKPSGWDIDVSSGDIASFGEDYWAYVLQIKNFYIQNENTEIDEYAYQFDVTEEQNGRVKAYLIERSDGSVCTNLEWEDDLCYDLYLQADGVIYPNEDASFYFAAMECLDSINNLNGIDTSNVIDMSYMFSSTGYNSENFNLNLSNFDTSKVTDMSYMFYYTGYNSENFNLNLSNFDTSNVTDMSYMFCDTASNSENFTLDVSNFDTSKVINMSGMFSGAGSFSENFTLDVSNFDTSKVTNMSSMFMNTGIYSENFTLDLGDNFDTSKVTDMSDMFSHTGYSNQNFTLDVSNFDTSKAIDMRNMFAETGYNSTKLNTSITISNPNTTSYSNMFYNVATNEGSQIKVNYSREIEALVSKMVATKSSNSNVISNCTDDSNYILIGTEIDINGEKFNVISQTEDTVTMLAQNNIGTNYKQSKTTNTVNFADTDGWEYTPGPKEIDIQTWSTNPKTYVNAYVEYLKEELGSDTVTGDLITLSELSDLGCIVPSNYGPASGPSFRTCVNSPYKSWLIIGKYWFTRSATHLNPSQIWHVRADGDLYYASYNENVVVRPTITISKETLRNLR